MQDFEFYTPTKIFFGKGKEKDTGSILKGYGIDRVLLHYGMGSIKKSGLYDTVTRSLKGAGLKVFELGGVQPNPKLGLVKKGIEICVREGIQAVLAVGGGSVIDSAKLIAVASASPETDPWDFSIKQAVPERALPVGVVLTISAAGSEMSSSCVITNEEKGLKRGFGSDFNRPLFAVMDPELTYTVSPYQTACGVVDIMMHTMERYFQPEPNSSLTDSIALALLKNVVSAGYKVMGSPRDYDARAQLMWASSLSHNDLTSAGKLKFLQLHQLEHEVSGMYDEVAHAAGLSALFNSWAKYIYDGDIKKFYDFAVNVWGVSPNEESMQRVALLGIQKCTDYFKNTLGLPVTLGELGIGSENLEEMALKCSDHKGRTLPGAKELDHEDILEIFKNAL